MKNIHVINLHQIYTNTDIVHIKTCIPTVHTIQEKYKANTTKFLHNYSLCEKVFFQCFFTNGVYIKVPFL